MVLEWKEWGHEAEDHHAAQDPECINVLRNCGLLNFFRSTGLRAQMELLFYLINLWDVDRELFIIKDQELELEETNIYFVTGLCRRGERIQLFGPYSSRRLNKCSLILKIDPFTHVFASF